MTHTRATFAIATAIATLFLFDCGGRTTAQSPVACAIGGVVYDNVQEPAPGAMSVSTAPGSLVLQETLPVAANVSLVTAAGSEAIALGVLPTAAPGATASPGPPPEKIFAYPQLQSATTYQVAYRAVSQAECPPELYGDGTFTTQ